MSLILDALNKADHERRKEHDETPGLDSHHDDLTPLEESRRLPPIVLIGVAGLVVAGLAAGAFFWEKESSAPAVAPAAMAKTQPVAKVEPIPDAAPVAVTTAPVKPAAKPTPAKIKMAEEKETRPEVAALYEKPVETPPPPPPRTQPQKIPTDEIARIMSAAKPTPKESPFQSTGKAVKPIPTAKPSRVPYPIMEDFTQIGTIRSLSWTTQEKIPSMTYSEHRYQPNDQGTVVLNDTKYKKGDRISDGLTLEAILYDGILLRYKGEVFKLQALSSWVNM